MKYKYEVDVKLPEGQNIHRGHLLAFFQFIYDRQMVWHNRFVKQLPQADWTNDPIFKRTKYTNVYRELDRGTLWLEDYLADNLIKEVKGVEEIWQQQREIFWVICVYRLLNKIETFEQIGLISFEDYGKKKKREKWFTSIRQLLESGFKVWTSAHITLQSNLKQDRITNYETILDRLHKSFDSLVKDVLACDDPQWAFKFIQQMYGFGPFISYEVASDLARLPWIKFDDDTWANAGPGCIPGIQLIFPKYKTQDQHMEAMTLLRDYQEKAFEKLGLDFMSIAHEKKWLTLRNIEHSLCEFRKYWCEQNGVGRPRPLFNPTSQNRLYVRR